MSQLLRLTNDVEGLAAYVDVIEQNQIGAINRYQFLNGRPAAKVDLIAAQPEPLLLPLRLERLERHPHSSQTFFPLGDFDYLVVVAQDDGEGQPDLSTLAAFRVSGHRAVSFAPTTWHRSVAALGEVGSFATVTCYAGTPDDIDFRDIPPIIIAES